MAINNIELKRLYNEISIEGNNIIGAKDDFMKKPIKSIKELLRK